MPLNAAIPVLEIVRIPGDGSPHAFCVMQKVTSPTGEEFSLVISGGQTPHEAQANAFKFSDAMRLAIAKLER